MLQYIFMPCGAYPVVCWATIITTLNISSWSSTIALSNPKYLNVTKKTRSGAVIVVLLLLSLHHPFYYIILNRKQYKVIYPPPLSCIWHSPLLRECIICCQLYFQFNPIISLVCYVITCSRSLCSTNLDILNVPLNYIQVIDSAHYKNGTWIL